MSLVIFCILGGSEVMGKRKTPIIVRTIIRRIPGMLESVRDVYPSASRSRKHQLIGATTGRTRVRKGEVYVQEGGVVKRYGKGRSFTEKPGVPRVIGSVAGAETSTMYKIVASGNFYSVPVGEDK
jgi:hypothetical protein